LHKAAGYPSSESMDVVLALIEGGADPTAQDKDGRTALHEALSIGHEGVACAWLLRKHDTISP